MVQGVLTDVAKHKENVNYLFLVGTHTLVVDCGWFNPILTKRFCHIVISKHYSVEGFSSNIGKSSKAKCYLYVYFYSIEMGKIKWLFWISNDHLSLMMPSLTLLKLMIIDFTLDMVDNVEIWLCHIVLAGHIYPTGMMVYSFVLNTRKGLHDLTLVIIRGCSHMMSMSAAKGREGGGVSWFLIFSTRRVGGLGIFWFLWLCLNNPVELAKCQLIITDYYIFWPKVLS